MNGYRGGAFLVGCFLLSACLLVGKNKFSEWQVVGCGRKYVLLLFCYYSHYFSEYRDYKFHMETKKLLGLLCIFIVEI